MVFPKRSYIGNRWFVWEPSDRHSAFEALIDLYLTHNSPREPIPSYDPNRPKVIVAEQPNSSVNQFYHDLKQRHAHDPLVVLASARWHWTQEDVRKLGIEEIFLWKPRTGIIDDADVVHKGFLFYPSPSANHPSIHLPWPSRPEDSYEVHRMVSRYPK